jgi:PAS domain S-box-containing protein
MLSRLRSNLGSLVFLKEEEAHYTARFVAYLLPVCAMLMLLFIILPLAAGNLAQRAEVGVPVLLAWVASWWLLRRGKVRRSALIFVLGTWAVATYTIVTRDGVRAPAYIAYLVLIVYAAFLVTPAAALTVFLISLLAGLGVVVAGQIGLLPLSLVIHTPTTLYASYSAYMLMIVLIVLVIAAEYRDAFGRLQASEERSRLLFEVDRDPILLLDRDGRFIDGNDAAAKAFGLTSRAELAGRTPAEFSPYVQPDDELSREKAERMIGTAFEEGSTEFEWTHLRADGSEFIVEVALTLVPVGRSPVLMAHLRDITAREQAAEALRRQLQLEEVIIGASTRFISVEVEQVDREIDDALEKLGRFAGADRAYVFQVREDRGAMDCTHEWCGEGVSAQIGRLQNVTAADFPWLADKLLAREVILIHRISDLAPEAALEAREFGEQGVESMICVPMVLADRVVGFFGFDSVYEEDIWSEETVTLLRVAADAITNALARRRAKQALRESEERFRSLVEATSDWIWEVDAQGVYTYVSPKVRDLLGYEPAEVLGRTPYDLMPPAEAQRVGAAVRGALENAQPFSHVENTNTHKDGHLVVLETSGVPVFDEHGALRGFHGIDRDITEQRRAQDALRESEQRFRAIVESTRDWIWFAGVDGVHRYSNRAIHDLLGYAPEEIVGEPVFAFIHPEDVPLARAQIERATAEQSGWSGLVVRWRHQDGTYRYLESAAAPAFSPTGELLGWYGADRDITERREAEAALRESEEKYRTLFEMLPVNATLHQDRRVVLANPASVAVFRTPDVHALIGAEITRFATEEGRELMEEHLRAGKRGGPEAPDYYFTTLRRADGEEFPAEVFAADVVYQGRPATQVVVLDISDRVRMQEALRASEARLRALFAAMSDVILVLDAEGRCLEIAPTKPDLLYRPAEELLGKTVHEVFPVEQADYFVGHIRQALATGHTTQMEYTFLIGGQEHCFSAAVSPLSSDTVIVVARDVTAVVEQRNRLLAAERARADLAEHLNEEINHRARNNLAMVSGLLQMQASQEPNAELAARLREAVARIRTFVDIHEKIYATGAEKADLLEVIQQVASTLRTVFPATAAEFSVEGAAGVFPTRTVTNLAVITNELMTNALRHGGGKGGRPIRVKVRLDRAEGRLQISVWNSGTPVPDGFDAAAQKGMGLRLVTGIAQQYGASFRVRPAEGGTVAELTVEEAALES